MILLKKWVIKTGRLFGIFVVICLLAAFSCRLSVYALGEDDARVDFDYEAQFNASGADKLIDELPEYAVEGLSEAGVHPGGVNSDGMSSLTQIDSAAVLNSFITIAGNEMGAPLAALGVMTALLLFASICKFGEQSLDSPLSSTFGAVNSLTVGITLVTPMLSLIDSAAESVDIACRFTRSFGAVFLGILIANGQTFSAAGYSTFLFGAIDVSSVCVNEVIMPMLRIFLALSCVSAVSDAVRLDAIMRFFDKYSKWLLGFLAVIVTTVLSISGVLSASADSVSSRAAKFVISGSVPVVGGAVSDAYLSIKSGMSMLRNSVGAFGIIGIAYVFIPVIIRTVMWNLVVGIGEAICESLELDKVQRMIKSLSAMLSLLLGVLVFSMFLLTLSSIIVIMRQ